MNKAPNRVHVPAAAISLSALAPAVALAHVVAGQYQDCSLRAALPGAYIASVVPALLTAAYIAYHRAAMPGGRAVTGIVAVVTTLIVMVGGGLAVTLLGVIGNAAIYPVAVMLAVYAAVGLPVFWLTLRPLATVTPGLAAGIAVVAPLAVIALGQTAKACHLID